MNDELLQSDVAEWAQFREEYTPIYRKHTNLGNGKQMIEWFDEDFNRLDLETE